MSDLPWGAWEQMVSSIYCINCHRLKSGHHFFPRLPQQLSCYKGVEIARVSPWGSSFSVLSLEFGFGSLNTPARWDTHESQTALWRQERLPSIFYGVQTITLAPFQRCLSAIEAPTENQQRTMSWPKAPPNPFLNNLHAGVTSLWKTY